MSSLRPTVLYYTAQYSYSILCGSRTQGNYPCETLRLNNDVCNGDFDISVVLGIIKKNYIFNINVTAFRWAVVHLEPTICLSTNFVDDIVNVNICTVLVTVLDWTRPRRYAVNVVQDNLLSLVCDNRRLAAVQIDNSRMYYCYQSHVR